jgi:HK97 family phage portal protein
MGEKQGIFQSIRGIFSPKKELRSVGNSLTNSPFTSVGTLLSQLTMGQNHSGEAVTAETSLRYSAIYACVRNISEDIGKAIINIQQYDKLTDNYININNNSLFSLLNIKPNDYSNAFALKESIQRDALLYGNGYAYIQRDNNGFPIQLHWLQNLTVNPMLKNLNSDNAGSPDLRIIYIVNDPRTGIHGTFQSFDILHIRGLGNGFVGQSVIGYASESFGKALATQKFGSAFFGSNGIKGLLKFAGQNDENKLKKAKESFKRAYLEDGLAVINKGMEWEKVNVAPEEAQFIQSQEFNVSDIARWFRMPLSKLQKSDISVDVEREAIEYVNDCLSSWQTRWEQEIHSKLLTETEKEFTRISFDNDYLLKGDSASQERRIKTMFYCGAWSPNDALKFMGYNTIGEKGNETYLPVNMIPQSSVDEFWLSKNPSSNIPQGSADPTGSGASNNKI